MERWVDKVAIVTGVSSGIGEAIAESLVKHGIQVVGLGRREHKLQEIEKRLSGQKGQFYPFKADLTVEEDILKAFKWTEVNLGAVHIVVNNAGIVAFKKLEEQTTSEWQLLYDTNVLALQISCREAIKSMKKNDIKDGHIINISSIGAHMSSPYSELVTYFASKKAVNAISEGIRVELAAERSDIRVSTICPGLTNTELFIPFQQKVPNEMVKLGMRPSDVSETVIFVLQVPPHVLISDLTVQPVRNYRIEYEKLMKIKKLEGN